MADDPRGALRWSLSRLRAIVDEPDLPRILAPRDSVAFAAQGAWVDILALKERCADGLDGVDSWLPIAHVMFEKNCQDIEAIFQFMRTNDVRMELQDSPDAKNWTEENGHYFIGLDSKTFFIKSPDGHTRVLGPYFEQYFKEYQTKNIREESREAHFCNYWIGVLAELPGFLEGFTK